MIGKIISCSSFAGTVGYVMKKDQSRILAAEGIAPPDVRDMVRDLKDQTLLNPRLKNAVGHISLSFSPKDADKLTDAKMTGIAREYMERMGIRDTQFLLVRHLDQVTRIATSFITVSVTTAKPFRTRTLKPQWESLQGTDRQTRSVLRQRQGAGKPATRLREPDKTKYEIYDAIRHCLSGCQSWGNLETRLQEQGITTSYKYCGQTDRKQGVLFGKNGFTFSGSKIDRAFSYTSLNRHFEQLQRVRPSVEQPRYSAQSVGNLKAAADSYRSAFSGLFKSVNVPEESVNLGAFGLKGGVPLPPSDFSGGLAPELMKRRIGESHEEYIARITALIQAAAEAMLVAAAEHKRKLKERKANKPKIGF